MLRKSLLVVVLFCCHWVSYGQFDSNRSIWFTDLNQAFKNPERVFNLDLSGQGLDSIPSFLPIFRNLKSLKLSDNNIRALNQYLNQLPALKYLELSGNRIRDIDFSLLEGLKYTLEGLWMRDNQITHIDSTINHLQSLNLLDLGNNKIATLDRSIQLKYLEILRLDNNFLSSAPALLHQSPKLQELNLYGNLLTTFELNATHAYLRKLNLGSNPISTLHIAPAKYRLKTIILDWVDFSQNNLPALPLSIETLSLEHCQLSEIPDGVVALPFLKELSLMHNNLSTLPEAICQLPRLKKIWLTGNPMGWTENFCAEGTLEIIR
ncbi:MAG TPA: leucine-rich repeat domain-containing protein [Saprospiraceae bacterium]|nr:leucine-rich repeat domain-containing protein [Saprospiraceae bacterium]HMQ84740.1 leucine-rich repeat domain-containing protein [Saprospiraceae bacterium]